MFMYHQNDNFNGVQKYNIIHKKPIYMHVAELRGMKIDQHLRSI